MSASRRAPEDRRFPGPANGEPAGPAEVSPDRLIALRSTFRRLRDEGREVMARLRLSLHEMQAHRERLRQARGGNDRSDLRNGTSRAPGGAPAPAIATRLGMEFGMTAREVDVALLLAEGCSNETVAQRLGISPHTARHHTQRVLGKLGVHSRSEAGARLRK